MQKDLQEVEASRPADTIEAQRLRDEATRTDGANWKRWGPYLAERQWGTVREDLTDGHSPWDDFPHDDANWRAYRWGEDGLLGISDRQCRMCFALALWNGKDAILKERLFGLSGPEGNHGEDVKEAYFYLDSSPTHSYMKGLYKYPQAEFPYTKLVEENRRRSRDEMEYELTDTGVFDDNRYFDVFVEYAKADPEDVLIRITVANRADDAAEIHVLPTVWFRNTWSWGKDTYEADVPKPSAQLADNQSINLEHTTVGSYQLVADNGPNGQLPVWLFTENDTNSWRAEDRSSRRPSCKDAFHLRVVEGLDGAVNVEAKGTKAAAHYRLSIAGKSEVVLQLRLRPKEDSLKTGDPFGPEFDSTFRTRINETDAFYDSISSPNFAEDEQRVFRQANAGLLWTKQFYYYSIAEWQSAGDAPGREHGRNANWKHLFNRDVISMPDKWEYPWYAAWDSAFHMIPFAKLDPDFARRQLILYLREWYMHPNGQIPAYEWNFGDVNPPVHAWACWRVYQLTRTRRETIPDAELAGTSCGTVHPKDRDFLARIFQKLLLNFTWWVNRKDVRGKQVFSGGFLGLDNIGIFDRSRPLPTGGHLEQADGTAWMAFYCSSMLSIAFELADGNKAYEDMASKFFEHYVGIAEAMNSLDGTGLWDEEDGFYYDHLIVDGQSIPLKIRSMVGIVPLFTVDVIYERVLQQLPSFQRRMQWFIDHRRDLSSFMTYMDHSPNDATNGGLRLLGIPTRERLERVLRYVLDEDEFLSPYGIRSLSKFHQDNPFVFNVNGEELRVAYVPGESDSPMFGGNSNWRGPIWFPMNFLLIEAFERYHLFYGDTLRIECPTGSGQFMNLQQVADELRQRLSRLFLADESGNRAHYCRGEQFLNDPHWRDLVLFYEYFHGDTGRGLGASHQTGWTALIATILGEAAERR